jgi:hypothetical protein
MTRGLQQAMDAACVTKFSVVRMIIYITIPDLTGLDTTEIVSLLIERSEQRPWICYSLISSDDPDVVDYRPDFVQPGPPDNSGSFVPQKSDTEVKRKIAELCGLGGIIPTPDGRALWGKAYLWLLEAQISSAGRIHRHRSLMNGSARSWTSVELL